MLARRGAFILDADQVSRDLVVPGSPVFLRIVEAFGEGVLKPDGQLDRAGLGRSVFGSPEKLKLLDELTHPPIWEELRRQLEVQRERGGVTVLMVPLLLEHGGERWVDEVWVVDIPRELQIQRLIQRGAGMSRSEAEARLAAQLPAELRLARADVVIDNSQSLEETERQIENVWQRHGW